MNQLFKNFENWFKFNETKKEVAQKPQNVFSNGILWNAYDTYQSVIFSKKFILNSRSKSTINRQEILNRLEDIGLTQELCKTILYDLWFGGGAGIVVYNENKKLEYVSMYQPYDCGVLGQHGFDYRKSRILSFSKGQLNYYKNPIQGSYFFVKKDYDQFGNYYSVIDKCITAIYTYNKLEAYNYSQASSGFQRNTFYELDSNLLAKMTTEDDEVSRIQKTTHNNSVMERMSSRISDLFKGKDNSVKMINSSIKPVFVDAEFDPEKQVKYKDGLIKTIALCANVPASSLGISNSANKSQSESDKDMLTNQATNYTNIFCNLANYWLSQFYPTLADDLFFTWEENETDESLQIREQNQKVLEFYTQNARQFSTLGITVSKQKLVELANSVSIPDLFVIQEEISPIRAIDEKLLDDVFATYHQTINLSYSELLSWSQRDISKEASLDRDPITRNLALLDKNKEDWTNQDITNANKTIAFVGRMKNAEQGETIKIDGKDTGWSKRDISLMNWAYNPKKTTRVNFSNIRIKSPSLDTWEQNSDVLQSQKDIEGKITEYIEYQFDNKNRSQEEFETLYPRVEFQKSLQNMSSQAINDYNQLNATDYDNIKSVNDYIDEVVKITYDGKGDYLGIHKTIDTAVANNQSISQVAKTSMMNINNNLFVPLFNQTLNSVAVEDGADYIGTVAKNDRLVRPHHLANQGKIWKLTDPNYWLERACRCNRFYGTVQELIDAGFSNPNNY